MATINDIIDNLENFQDVKFKKTMEVTQDLQTKQLEALNNINESLKNLKDNMGGSGDGTGGNSGGFFDDLLRRIFGDGTGGSGFGGILGRIGGGLFRVGTGLIRGLAGGVLGILGTGLTLVFEGAKVAFEGIRKIGQTLWDYGRAGVSKAIDVAKNLASGIASGLKNIVSTMVNTISSGVKSLVNMGISSFKELVIQPMLEGAEIYIDTTNQIRKEIGWQKNDYEQFAGSMSRMVGELGNKVGASDILKKAHEVVQLGIKDEEAVSAYTKTLMKMQLALDIDASGMKNLLELTKRLGVQGAQAIEKLGKSIRALDDANLVKALGNKDLMAFAEKMSDVFGGNAEVGSEEWLKENQWAMSGYNELAKIDPKLAEGLGNFMAEIGNAKTSQLGDLSVKYGMDVKSIRDMIDSGNIEGVMREYTAKASEYIESGLWDVTDEAWSGWAGLISRSTGKRLQREGKLRDREGIMSAIEEGYLTQRAGANAISKDGKDNLDENISGLNVGLQKEMQNSQSALGIHYGEMLRDTGVHSKDVSWAVNKLTEMVTLGFDMVQSLVGSVISGVKNVFDILVPAPVQTALAIAGVMYIGYRVFGDYLMKAAKGITEYITDAIIGLGNFMLDALPGAMQLAMDVFVGAFNFIIDTLPGLFNLLKDAIIGLGKYIIDSLPGVFNLAVDALTGLGSYLIDAIKGVGNFIVDALPGTLYFLKDVIFGLGYFIKDFILSEILYIKDALKGIAHYLTDLLPGLFDYVLTAGGQLIHWLWDSLSKILPTIAISLVKGIGEAIWNTGKYIIEGFINILPPLGELIIEVLKSLGNYLVESIKTSGKFIGGWIEYGADLLINKGKEVLISGLEFIAGVFDSFTDKLIDILNLIPGINISKDNPEEREKRRHESLVEMFGVKNSEELRPPSFDELGLPDFEKFIDSNAFSEIKDKLMIAGKKHLENFVDIFEKPLDTLGEGLEKAVNDIPDLGDYVTADFFEHAGKYLKRDENGNVMQITDYIGEVTNGNFLDYLNRQTNGKTPIDYLNEQTKGKGIKDYIEENGGNTDINSYIDQQTGGKNVFDYLKENVGDLSNYLTANGNIMDYLRESVDNLNSYISSNGTILDYISDKLKGSPMDYLTVNGTPLDYISRQTGGKSFDDYIPEMDKQQVMTNLKSVMGDVGNLVQEGLGESLKLIGIEHGDEIAKQGMDFMKSLFDKATAGASSLMESGQNLLGQVDLNKLMNSAGDIGSLLSNTLSSGLSPLAGNMQSLLSNIQNFNQSSGAFQKEELSASKSIAHSVADVAKSLNPNYSLPAYEEGTPLVGSGETFDSNAQVAVLHEGEAVVPADQNPYNLSLMNTTNNKDKKDIAGVTRDYINSVNKTGESTTNWGGIVSRSQAKVFSSNNSGNPLDREAMRNIEGAVRDSTNIEIQNDNINADRDSQLQGIQINQGRKNEEQHNLEIKQKVELIEQEKILIKQGEEDKVIQTKITENQSAFTKLFESFYNDWKSDRDSDNKFYTDTLANLMGIHNNTGGIAMILMQTGGKIGQGKGLTPISKGSVTPLTAPGGNASLDQKADYVYSELIRNGFSKDVAAGIVGNLMNENLAEHDQSHADYYGDGSYAGMGGGMAAWLNERFTGLQDFAKAQGKDWKDLGVQTQFLLKELDNMPDLKQRLLSGNLSVNDAAELFMREFERPATEYAHLDRRQSSAQAVRQRDNGSISSISPGGDSSGLSLTSTGQELIPVSTNQSISPTFQGNIPNYKQYENGQGGSWDASAWGNLQASGCAPAALAMQAQAVTGKIITPADVANWGASAGLRNDKSGLIMQGAKQFGYSVQKIDHATLDSSGSALEALKKGIPVVMGIGAGQLNGLGGQSGHYFTATGIDENGHIKINDPGHNDEFVKQNFSNFTWEDMIAASPDMYVPTLVNMNGQGNTTPLAVNTPASQPILSGGNTLRMDAQFAKECTQSAMAALWNAYTGQSTTSADWGGWSSELDYGNTLNAQFHSFSSNQREQFEQTVKSHFDANPNRPIYLYQAGGAGSGGGHALNRGSGTHATVIGRRLENGKYQVFDSNGFDNNMVARVHELDLSEIFDPTANGGDSLSGMNVGEGNNLWIPQVAPTKEITNWEVNGQAVSGTTGQQGSIPQQSGQPINIGGFQPSFAGQATFSGISSSNFAPATVTGGGTDYQSQVISLLRGIARALGVDTRAITNAVVQSSNNQGQQVVGAINSMATQPVTVNQQGQGQQSGNASQGHATLTGSTNEEKIWGFLKTKGLSDEQVAGIMGNLQQESNFDPNIIEGGGHSNSATGASFNQGYGIAQWTFERKDDLEKFAKSLGKSSGDLEVQLEFLWHELNNSESEALQALKGATDVATATDLFHRKFERSADAVSDTRIGYGQDIYNKLKGKSFAATTPQQQNLNQANQQEQQVVNQANRNNQNIQGQNSQSRQLDEATKQLISKLMKDTGLTSDGLKEAVNHIDKILKRSYLRMGSNGIEISETDIKKLMDTQDKTEPEAIEILKKEDKYLKFSEDMLKQMVYSSGEKIDENHLRALTALGFSFQEAVDTLRIAKGEQINSRQQIEEFIKGTGLSKEFLEKNVQNIIKANNRDLRLLGENGIEISDNDLKYALSLDWIKGDMDKAVAFLKSDSKYNEITNEMIRNLTTKDGKHLKIEDLKSLTKMGYTLKEAVNILDNPEELKKLQDKESEKGNSVAELANKKNSNISESSKSPFRVDSEALIQKYIMRDRMVFGSFGQTLADRKGLGEWIVQNKGELPPGYRQWSNPLSRAGMPNLLYGRIIPGQYPGSMNTPSPILTRSEQGVIYRNGIPISTPPFVSPQGRYNRQSRDNSIIYQTSEYDRIKSNFKSGIDKVLKVELGYNSIRDLQEASKNLKISSKNLDKSSGNMDEALTDITAPSGQKYSKNDLDYLLNNKYSKEDAIELLSKDVKYMKLDLSKFEKSKNNKEFDSEDVRDLLIKNRDNKDYTVEKAIEELSKSDKYSKSLDELAKLEKSIKDRIASGENKDDELGKIINEIKKANVKDLRQLSVKYGIDSKAIKESIEKVSGKNQQSGKDTLENRNKILKDIVDKLSPKELAMKYGLAREEIEALQIKYKGKSDIPEDFVDPIGNKIRQLSPEARIGERGELLIKPQEYYPTLTAGQRQQLMLENKAYYEWKGKQIQERASRFSDKGKAVSYEEYMNTRMERLAKEGIFGFDNQSIQALNNASDAIKESSKSMKESASKIEEGSGKISESKIEISKNDLDYLTKVKKFTEEQAMEMLNKDVKYMKIDTSNLEKSLNNREFSSEDIRRKLIEHREDKDYSIEKAIQELNQTAKYSKSVEELSKLEKDLKERVASGENKDDELGRILKDINSTSSKDLGELSLKYGIDSKELESIKKSITPVEESNSRPEENLTRDERGIIYRGGIPISTPPFVSPQQGRLPYGISSDSLIFNGGFTGGYRQQRITPPIFGGNYYQPGNLTQTLHPFKTLIQTFFGRDYKKGNEDFATGAQNYRDAVWSGNNFEGNIYSDLKPGVDWLNILFNTGTGSIGKAKRRDILTSTGGIGTHAYQFDQNSLAGMFIGGFNQRQVEMERGIYLTPGQDNIVSTGYYYQQNYPQQYYSQIYQQPYYQYPRQIQKREYSSIIEGRAIQQRIIPQEGTYEYYMDKASRAKRKEDMTWIDKLGAHSQEYWIKKAEEAKAMGNIMNPELLEKQSVKITKESKKSVEKEEINEDIIKSSGKEYSKNDIAYLRQFDWIKSDEDAMKYLDNNSWKYKDIDWAKQGLTVKDNKLFTKDNKEINEKELRQALDLKEINGDMTKALEYLSEQAKKAGDNLGDTGDKIEETNKDLAKVSKENGEEEKPLDKLEINGKEIKSEELEIKDKNEKTLDQSRKEFRPEFDEFGNIINLEIPEFNKVTKDDDLQVTQAKWDAQNKQMLDYMVGLGKKESDKLEKTDKDKLEINNKSIESEDKKAVELPKESKEIVSKNEASIDDINKLYKDGFNRIEGDLTKINPDTFKEERDEFRNIINLPGMLKDNLVTGQETELVRKAKLEAQQKEKEKILSDIREFNNKKLGSSAKEKEIKVSSSNISEFDKSKEEALNRVERDKKKYTSISEQTKEELREKYEKIIPNQNTFVSSKSQEFLERIPIGDLTVGGGITGQLPRSRPTLLGGSLIGGSKSQFKKGTYEYNIEMAMGSKRKEEMNSIDKLFGHSQEYYLEQAEKIRLANTSKSKGERAIIPEKSEMIKKEKNQEITTFGKNKQYKKEHIDYLLTQDWIKNEEEAKKYLDNNSWQYKEVDWTKMGLTQKDNKLFTENNKEIKESDLRIALDREDIKGDIKKAIEYLSNQEKLSQELVDETKNTNSTLEDQLGNIPEQISLDSKEEQLLATKDNIKIDGKTYEDSLKELDEMHSKKYGIDALTGNMTGLEIPEELKISKEDSKEVKDAKFAKQQELMQSEISADLKKLDEKYEAQAGMLNQINKSPELQKSIQEAMDKGITPETLPEFDKNGNIINIPGMLKDNMYNPETDDLSVRDAKFKAQNQQYAEILEGIRTRQSVELIKQQDKEKVVQEVSAKSKEVEQQINQEKVLEKAKIKPEEPKSMIISKNKQNIDIPKESIKKFEKETYEWYIQKADKAPEKGDFFNHSKQYWIDKASEIKLKEEQKKLSDKPDVSPVVDEKAAVIELNKKEITPEISDSREGIVESTNKNIFDSLENQKEFDNIEGIDIPEYNIIDKKNDSIAVQREKYRKQLEQLGTPTEEEINKAIEEGFNKSKESNIQLDKEVKEDILPKSDKSNISSELKFDKFGNITNIDIPEFNKVIAEDDMLVAKAKWDVQDKQMIDEVLSKNVNSKSEVDKEYQIEKINGKPLELTDEGNLPGLDIPEYNKIDLKNDILSVQDAKLQVQTDQMIEEILSGKYKSETIKPKEKSLELSEKYIGEESAQSKLENLKKRVLLDMNKLESLTKSVEESSIKELSQYDKIDSSTVRMTKEQESKMLDELAKESGLKPVTSSIQEEQISKKITMESEKSLEETKNKELKDSISQESGKISKEDIKIEGKTYEESLSDLNKELDNKYGIDVLTGNITGIEIPEEFKLTGKESKEEKAMKIEKQNELMAKDQEVAYKELEDKYNAQAGMLEMIDKNPELAKSIEEAEKAGINPDTFVPEFDKNGNITNLPGMLKDNIFNPETDDLSVRDAKFKAQNNQYAEILEGLKTKKTTELIDKSENKKPLSEESKETSIKPETSQESSIISPRGIPYEQNDIDYLLNNGYTPEAAFELLAKHPKYMKIDMSQIPKAPNGKEFSEDEIRNLLINGYELEDAINFLSKDKKYSVEGTSKQEQATTDIGQAAKTNEVKVETSQSTLIQDTSGTAESGEITETVNPSSETSSQGSNTLDVGDMATQAESAKSQVSQIFSSAESTSSSSSTDLIRWAVGRIESKLDGVISAIQNNGGNKSITNNYSTGGNNQDFSATQFSSTPSSDATLYG